MSSNAASSDASPPVDSPNVVQRRQYFREKQRKHRHRRRMDRDEIAALQTELAALELQQRTRTTPPSTSLMPLSWEIISSIFRQSSSVSLATQKELLAQVAANKATLAEIQQFLASCAHVPRVYSWGQLYRHATLPAVPDARRRAKEWLTLQMYHNMDRIWQQFPLVAADDTFQHADVQFDGPCINVVQHEQLLLPFPLPRVVSLLRHRLNSLWQFDPNELRMETASNTRYYSLHNNVAPDPSWNSLGAYFAEADRCVMVFRRVQGDEMHASTPATLRTAHALEWKELRRVSATQTSMRSFCVMSQRSVDDRFLSVDEIVRAHGWDELDDLVEPSEAAKRQSLRAMLLTKVADAESRMGERFLQVITTDAAPLWRP
ncbi:Aste57867_3042 [Aphanomyces stellatus]|uniref:Aste57867_3042 protein n=1 Tax=Aphanomyces stellatus TaxID=120398 RepID=A0A485K8X9_9STRA|nr:hypothetical protein As57867_003033 [Aphanomyces stellatus]VFT80222.1 Aste57867_3042 [Aphanomyces stellatus]